jgi:hypothetical protein
VRRHLPQAPHELGILQQGSPARVHRQPCHALGAKQLSATRRAAVLGRQRVAQS